MGQCYVLLFAIFLVVEEVRNSMAIDTCTSDSDCPNTHFTRRYCCRSLSPFTDRKCRFVSSCNGHYCLSNRDCNGPGDLCCVSSTCTSKCRCQNDRNCERGQYCCLGATSDENRCGANCLGKYCPNRFLCGSDQECCRSNVCVNCSEPGCRQDYECAVGLYCCQKDQGGICSASCVGTTCVTDSDCAGHSECCHVNKCIGCLHLKCNSNSECATGYCCRGLYGTNSRCMPGGCVGQSCHTSRDCGGLGECCRNKKCAYCSDSRCKDSTECRTGEFCCKRNGQAICRKSCVGLYCTSREDCGAPGECCIENKCTTSGCYCVSNFDCNFGKYCCSGYGNNGCNTSCIGKTCLLNSDCGAPNETCTFPDRDCIYSYQPGKKCPDLPEYKCFNSNGCYSHSDCNIFGTGYYCCNERYNSERSCNSICINKYCNADRDCGGSSECCNSKNECQKCSNSFPNWVIGVIIVIVSLFGVFVVCLYTKIKKRRMGQRETTQSTPEIERPNNCNNQARHSSNVQSTVDSTLYDDVQSIQLRQISASPLRSHEPLQYSSSELDYPPSVNSRYLSVQNMNETNATVVPSPPPSEGSIPSRPPPSYRELFGDR